jgi:hypothetical protein
LPSSKTGLLSAFGIQAMVSLPSSNPLGVSWATAMLATGARVSATSTTTNNKTDTFFIEIAS